MQSKYTLLSSVYRYQPFMRTVLNPEAIAQDLLETAPAYLLRFKDQIVEALRSNYGVRSAETTLEILRDLDEESYVVLPAYSILFEMYREYFTVMRDEIYAHPFINALAHIDYIARNSTFDNPEISYGEFTDEIDAVLRALVETDTAIEINTRRLGMPRGIKELAPIYRRYHELGGRYVTIGSDAHIPKGVGRNYARARELARVFDLTVVTFRERQMRICE